VVSLGRNNPSEANAMRMLSYKDLKPAKGIPYSEEWIRSLIEAGKFPRPVRLGEKRVGFVEAEIDQWLKDRAAERDRVSHLKK
jgi:prophage regulatory protein